MKRRDFLKNTAIGGTSLMILPSGLSAFSYSQNEATSKNLSEIEKGFLSPPDSSKPWVFWQWMNGNITKEGITLDLEAMNRMGIGGALCFNNAVGIPRGPIDYASDLWLDMVKHATYECARLKMTLMLHNGSGYSGSGGPWVTPEMSMQQLVWTETQVRNLRTVKIALPKPQQKEHYYRDGYVLAYPSLTVENGLMHESLTGMTLDGEVLDKSTLLDQNPNSKIRMDGKGEVSALVLSFKRPFEARSITITRKPEEPRDMFDGPRDHPPKFTLESSNDGVNYSKVTDFSNPELREMETPSMQNFKAVKARYFRLSTTQPTWLSSIELHSAPRLAGWPGKANWTHGNSHSNEPDVDDSLLINPNEVIDISSYMSERGFLKWKAPKNGNWTIVRFGHTTTGEEPAAHADAGKGLEIDKFRREAVDFHYEKFLKPVINQLGDHAGKTFNGFTTDSWEAGKQNWSVVIPEEFKKRRGYGIGAWLLAMTGRIVDSVDKSVRFLWDMNKTQTELLAENYYGRCQELCHQHGLQYHAEPYGDGNLDSLLDGKYLDVPMSEFWTRYIYGSEMTSKQAASIAHVYGKKIVAAECFTGMPLTSKWTNYPYANKAEGDWFFTLGVTRLVLHVFVHQPYTTGLPGMTMGPFGTHFDRNNTWTEQAYGWIDYIRRAQFLLQQGITVADVAYFRGDHPTSGIPDIYRLLPAGYVGDVVGPDALFSRFSIDNGKIELPDGVCYKVCMLAPVNEMLVSTASRLRELVSDGMVLIVSSKPSNTLGLGDDGKELLKVINELYGDLDGESVKQRSFGKGQVIWNSNLEDVLGGLGINPDFQIISQNPDAAIHFIHKKIEGGEYYFITNHKRRKECISCSLRIGGLVPELWNAENGETFNTPVCRFENGRTIVGLELAPAESVFLMFRKKGKASEINSIQLNGQSLLSTKIVQGQANYKDVINNFSISFWAKPDTYAHNGKSMVFHAVSGEDRYGKGHATCGLGIGQNAVRVYENLNGRNRTVLTHETKIEGWSHFALVYKSGKPFVYINGKMVSEGDTSENQVHPGLNSSVEQTHLSSFFEGNHTEIQLTEKSLGQSEIEEIYNSGLSAPSSSTLIKSTGSGFVFTENGKYELKGAESKIIEIKECSSQSFNDSWTVSFPEGSGAPAQLKINELKSLRLHDQFDVKHFSGTANYSRKISLKKEDFIDGRRFLIDLGRVEVVAEVKVNGNKVALLWKEPFVADITEYAKEGINEVEIAVTNLWPNRLIGDEHLPQENEYSEHRFINKLPDWYINNKKKPGDRVTFSVWKHYDKNGPLLESGLLGPVRLIMAEECKL